MINSRRQKYHLSVASVIGSCNSTEEDNWAIIAHGFYYYCLDENHSSRGVGSRRRYIQMAETALIEGKIF